MLFRLSCLLLAANIALPAAPPEWDVRYLLKASTPEDRPRWRATWIPGEAATRSHLALTQTGPAAGGVVVGRRIRVPQDVAELELSATFQTFCAMENRSGSVDLGVLPVAVWDALGSTPEQATMPPAGTAWLLRANIHANRQDTTDWRTGQLRGKALAALADHVGKEVVIAVQWSTWHSGSEEWFRLADLRLGEPLPWIAAAWPHSARSDMPLSLTVEAWAPKPPRVELGWRSGDGEAWQWVAMQPSANKQHVGSLPPAALQQPIQSKARMTTEEGQTMETAPQTITPRTPRVHPCVFYTPDMLADMRQRMADHEWAREIGAAIKRSADAWKDRADVPPTGPGGWSHDYACPDDGARLKWREDRPHDHLCPRCNKEWQGAKLDATWRNHVHGRLIGGARDCALAAQLFSDPSYQAFPRRILAWYAENYRDFPEGHGPAGRGRVMSQSLSECSWLLSAMEAADLAFPFMTEAERQAVETGFIEPGVQQISRFTFGIHNIQCWHNACMACAGYFLGDDEWVKRATEGKLGFRQQVEKGILEDGLWYERSLGYHNYTVRAMVAQCEAARLNGDPLHEVGRMKMMFTAPLRLSFPNLVPPSLNDQGYKRSEVSTYPLEMAWAWYRDPVAASALRKRYAEGASRNGRHLLKYGSDVPAGEEYVSPGSVDMSGAGLAILRQNHAEGPCAMVEYGEHGGGHGHPDKLQLILYGLGQPLCPDLGTTGYGVPLHSQWYKTTPGHNTVTIGARNQKATTGKLLAFEAGDGFSATAVESAQAYSGWDLRRHLLLTDGFLVDVFDVTGKEADTVDWFLHPTGQATPSLDLEPDGAKAESKTYAYLKEMRSGTTGDAWSCAWTTDRGTMHLTMAGEAGTRVTLAKAPGPAGDDPWDTLCVRRETQATRFVAVYQFLKPGVKPEPVQLVGGSLRIGPATVSLPTKDNPLPALR